MAAQYHGRAVRKNQIYNYLVQSANNGKPYQSALEIARELKMSYSNHLLAIIYEMVNERLLAHSEFLHRKNIIGRKFAIKSMQMYQRELL